LGNTGSRISAAKKNQIEVLNKTSNSINLFEKHQDQSELFTESNDHYYDNMDNLLYTSMGSLGNYHNRKEPVGGFESCKSTNNIFRRSIPSKLESTMQPFCAVLHAQMMYLNFNQLDQ